MSKREQRREQAPAAQGLAGRLTERVLNLPRLARIVLVCLFAMAVTVLLIPLVDGIYLRSFYSPETAVLPSLIEAAFGLGMFVLGWVLLVGFAGQRPPARLPVALYFLAGCALVLVVILQLISGVLSVSATG
ncbi:MAG: hypothetical protein KME04_02790 [Pleurocapsa minor GSE-CHR-MK-17-07R]|jgi:hypothetical protein|nr:hypothetical protein [Pleurocapsa minor GSE-CHR-MK 17-07R]